MNRRKFLKTALATTAVSTAFVPPLAAQGQAVSRPASRRTFKLKYAPHFRMFEEHAGEDFLDQLRFMADQGFTALEDNRLLRKPVELQEKIGAELERLGMTMGVFVAHAEFGEVTFASTEPEMRERLLGEMRVAVEAARRVNARWVTVVPGAYDKKLAWDYQTANVIENLKRCAGILEPAGLTIVIEPLNTLTNHPGVFLTKIPQAYMICRSVGSPACKILFDIYHQQITEGNIIPNIDMAWDEVGYFQVGDNPGRKEPGTGELNYRNIFRHIHGKGFQGIVGMEHGNSRPGREGEQAVIDAYVAADAF